MSGRKSTRVRNVATCWYQNVSHTLRMRVEIALQGVFFISLTVLALLPFLHGYLAATSEKNKQIAIELESKTEDAVRALSKLKAASTMFDEFVKERQKRSHDRILEQERLIAERTTFSSQNSNGEAKQLDKIRARIRKEQQIVSTAPLEKGLIGKYAEAHKGALPILIVCHNRPKELGETLDALLSLQNVDPALILVSQDGSLNSVQQKVQERGLSLLQNLDLERKGWGASGRRIAWHYKFSLNAAFEKFSDAPAVIILEDDLRVSPDFVDWFIAAGGVVEKDPTLWCVSAWNDNGFRDLILVEDGPYRIKRTSLFPGLGWLLLRSEYDLNLRQQWPDDQWDWYVRGVYQRKERECVYPELSRTFHAGRSGTFVNENDQRAIFDRMARNERSDLNWQSPEAIQALRQSIGKEYDSRVEVLLADPNTVHVKEAFKFQQLVDETYQTKKKEAVVVLWYDANPDPKLERRVTRFAKYFGIWHQLLRSAHESMHEIYFQQKVRLFLINTFQPREVMSSWFTSYAHQSIYTHLKPADVPSFDPEEFMTMSDTPQAPQSVFPAKDFGQSCDETCSKLNLRCDAASLKAINLCMVVKQHFGCRSCEFSVGEDQPCLVSPKAPQEKSPGTCLVNSHDSFSCSGKHPLTKRLCACIK